MSLSDYAEKNYDDLRTLESYVGKWSDIADNWGADWYMAPTITDFIGQAQKLFNDPSADENDYEEFKKWFKEGWNLTAILGELPKMWRAVNEGGANIPISFADAIVALSNQLTAHMNAASDKFDEIALNFKGVGALIDDIEATIGTDTGDWGPIYPALNKIRDNLTAESEARRNADTTLQNNLDAEEAARLEADNGLSNRLDMEKDAREQKDNELQAAINAEVSLRAQEITRIEGVISTTKSNLQKEIDDDNVAQSAILTAAYQEADTNLDTKLSNALTSAQDTLNKSIETLSQLHQKHYEELNEDIDTINTTLGTKPDEKTVFNRLANADTEIEKLKTSLGSTGDKDVATQFSDLDTKIENVKTSIGTSTDAAGTGTVYGAIATNKASIENIMTNFLTQTNANAIFLSKDAAANEYAKKRSDTDEAYLVESEITELRTTVSTLNEDVSNLKNSLGQIVDGQNVATILTEILSKIEGIETSIQDINERIDEYHTTESNQGGTDPGVDPDIGSTE